MATIREMLNDEEFDWETGKIIYQEVEGARTIDLLSKELLVELEKRGLNGIQSLSEMGRGF